ncbi:hypothetical protein [Neobacillus sp. LXY-4]|uniref:hypothetical protein n=1 Tax=Neobacillus sp. LXY-4 TaxID=3379826 RepID=UPI003EE2110C
MGCLLDTFIHDYNQKSHIHNLGNSRELRICFDTDRGKYFLSVENGVAQMLEKFPEGQDDVVTIVSSYSTAVHLLGGKMKLREAVSHQLLTVSASLRKILLLEAVLFLTKQGSSEEPDLENLTNVC